MVQRSLEKSTSLLGTVYLCTTILSLSFVNGASARDTYYSQQEAQIMQRQAEINALKRQIQQQKLDALHAQRKAFPPDNAANTIAPPAETHPQVITRSSPAYRRLADSNLRVYNDRDHMQAHRFVGETPKRKSLIDIVSSVFSSSEDEEEQTQPRTRNTARAHTPPAPIHMQPRPAPAQAQYEPPRPSTHARQAELEARELIAPTPVAQAPQVEPPQRIVSPGVIIKRKHIQMPLTPEVIASATPEQLAAYAPAAGSPADGVSGPMIQLPNANTQNAAPPPPVAAPTPTPVAAPVAPIPPAPAAATAPAAPTAPIVPPPVPVQTKELAVNPQPKPLVTEDSAISEPAPKLPTLTPQVPVPAAKPAPITHTEPVAGLTRGSKNIVRKLRPIADEKPREPMGLTMDRTKDTRESLDATIEHDSEGVNIKVKAPTINVSYELEKAYTALIGGNSMAANAIYRRVLAYEAKNVDALFGLATLYHRSRQLDKARPLYGRILAINPEHREALNNFLVLLADEAPEAALEQLAVLEKKSPAFSPIPAQMAVIYQKLGKIEEASEKMFRAVALAPENLTYRYNLAIMLDRQGNAEEAKRLYQHLVQAHYRGEAIPGNIAKVQERLTFLRSNNP